VRVCEAFDAIGHDLREMLSAGAVGDSTEAVER
jgi:hypothetical protein